MGILHIRCLRPKLLLDLTDIVEKDHGLSRTISSIHTTMNNCKSKLKNRGTLKDLTDPSPITYYKTRWTSKYFMLKRFYQIRDEIIEAERAENTSIQIDASDQFRGQAIEIKAKLKYFHSCYN